MARLKVEIECPMTVVVEVTVPDEVAENYEGGLKAIPDVLKALDRRIPSGKWTHWKNERRIVDVWRES